MNEVFTKELFDLCPLLYRDKDLSAHESLVSLGFEYEDGWYDITKKYSLMIERELNILYLLGVPKEHLPRALSMKAQYGKLSFHAYISIPKEFRNSDTQLHCMAINEAIDELEKVSLTTCEYCSRNSSRGPKIYGNNRYLLNLCEECSKKEA